MTIDNQFILVVLTKAIRIFHDHNYPVQMSKAVPRLGPAPLHISPILSLLWAPTAGKYNNL